MTSEERHLEIMNAHRELNKKLRLLLCINLIVLTMNIISLIILIYG